MASIVKTPSGSWKEVIRKKGWPTTAKTFRVKRDVVDWARGTEDEMVRGVYLRRSPSEKLTLSDALDRYLKEVTPTKKATTQRSERIRAKGIQAVLGKYSLAALSPELIAKYRDDRLEQNKKPNTVRLELALLGHLYTVAIKEWGIGLAFNPVSSIRRPSPGEGRNRRLSNDEKNRLLVSVDEHSNPMLGWIVRIALHTAMRQGEILSLTRDQVDSQRRVVRLTDTKNGSARTVPLSQAAIDVFRDALNNPIRPINCDLIFFGEPGKDGDRRSYTINRVWVTALKRAGINNFRFHDLRHEATSRLVEAGLSDQEVAAITGHKSMQMLRRYTHLRAEDLVEKLDRLES